MAEKNSLWKNIRNKAAQNRRTGATPKKPTTEMLRQERKIRAKHPDGGPVGDDDLMLSKIYSKYPAFKNMGNVTLKADPSFTKEKTGLGEIEYFSPTQDTITYPTEYKYPHPNLGTHGIVYNPNIDNVEESVRLDLLHGMPISDKVYAKHRDEFGNSFKKENQGEIDYWWSKEKEKYGDGDGKESFEKNYIDGIVRGLLLQGNPEDMGYSAEANKYYLQNPEVSKREKQLENYLQVGKGYMLPEVEIFDNKTKAEGGYYPTQGPPKALFKGYAQGGYTNPYNQYQDDPYLQYADGGYTYAKGGWKKFGNTMADIGLGIGDVALGAVGSVTGIKSLQDTIGTKAYHNDDFDTGANFVGKLAGTALKYIPVTAPFAQAAGVVGGVANAAIGIDRKNYDPSKHQADLDKAGDIVNLAGNVGTMFVNPSGAAKEGAAAAKGIYGVSGVAAKAGQVGKIANTTTTTVQAANTANQIGQAANTAASAVNTASNIAETAKAASNIGEVVQQANTVADVGKAVTTAAPVVDSANKLSSGLKYGEGYYDAVGTANKVSKYGSAAQNIASVAQPIMQQQQQVQQQKQQQALAETSVSTEPMYSKPDANTPYAGIVPPTITTGISDPSAYTFGYQTPSNNFYAAQGGNITNNSLNLRNTMRYKRFAKGGTFDQFGINMIPESAGLHHESAYGGVPIGPDALAEGGEVKMDVGNGSQYIVSDQVDGAETQKDFMFSKGGKYKELNRTLADGMKQDLNKYTFGSLATSNRVKSDLRRPNDTYAQSTIEQIKNKWQQKTEYARQRTQQNQAIAQAEEQKRMAEEQYIAAYGGKINPKKYPGLNMTKKAKGGYVHNQMTQPMLAEGGPLYGDPASPYTYAMGGPDKPWTAPIPIGSNVQQGSNSTLSVGHGNIDNTQFGSRIINEYGNGLPNDTSYIYQSPKEDYFYNTGQNTQNGKPVSNYNSGSAAPLSNNVYQDRIKKLAGYARGGQINYTNDMYAGGGPLVGNVPQPFKGPAAQNRGGMLMTYPDGGMVSPEQQMMQEQQMQQQAPQEQMQQQPNQEQMMQMVQQAAQMLEQGAQPEQVMQQLVQAGVPQDMAMQAVQMAMQEMQGQMQQQGQEQPMQGQEQMMPPQAMSRGGRMYAEGGNSIEDEDPSKIRKQKPKYYDDTDAYMKDKKVFDDKMSTYKGYDDWNYLLNKTLADPNRPFKNHEEFGNWADSEFGKINAANPTYKKYATLWKKPVIIKHPDGSKDTSYRTHTGTEPIDVPTLRMQELAALKADLSNNDVPTIKGELGTITPSTHTPKKVQLHRTNSQTQGVLPEDNPAFNYDPGYQVNAGDTTGWKNVPKGEYIDPTSKEVYPSYVHYMNANSDEYNIQNVPKDVADWTTKWLNPEKRASGGMMSPQDGMSNQVAQQLKQGIQPQVVLDTLVKQGMPQEQAMAMVQAVMTQVKSEMQQPQQQMMPQEQMAPQQPMMAARGGYFNGRKQYGPGGGNNGDVVSPDTTNTFSPLADQSTMSQIAGLGQAVVPALTSAYAFNKLSKRKLTPSLVENVNIDYTPERISMMDENRRNVASGLSSMRNMAPTSGSYMGNARGLILDANKISGQQIAKSWQDQKNEQAKYDYQTGTTNAGIRNQTNQTNEEMYQNAMQTGFTAADKTTKDLASYYADTEDRNLQRWQAMNTTGENWTWTPKGKAFRNKDGIFMINGKPVDPSTGNPV